MKPKVFIIAEAGVNHNGSLSLAKKMVKEAARSGADAIKFQSFKTECLVTKKAAKAKYQRLAAGCRETQFEMIKKLELDESAHRQLMECCKREKITFLSSAFDLPSLDLLRKLGVKIFKVPSGEINNLPYLRKIGALRRRIILSTGMSTLAEIKEALYVLMKNGLKKKDITVLQCNNEYPTPIEDVNLKAMLTIRDAFKVKVGYSDHTLGIDVAIAAVALGAQVIEKHFTLNKELPGPDHKASLEPHELKKMVCAIRNFEKALGNGLKEPSRSEIKNIKSIRKSIVAAREIKKGEKFTAANITVKRPGTGLNPMLWDSVLGKAAKQGFKKDQIIKI